MSVALVIGEELNNSPVQKNLHLFVMFGMVGGVGLMVYILIWLTQKLAELPGPPPPHATTTPLPDRHMPYVPPVKQG